MILSSEHYYFKIFDNKKRLLLEGHKSGDGGYFTDDVKFYNRHGDLKRIEHWPPEYTRDSLDISYVLSDGPVIVSSLYYNQEGFPKKKVHFELEIDEHDDFKFRFRKVITKF